MRHVLHLAIAATAAIHASAAYAQSTTTLLPNGITVPYYGQSAPSFRGSASERYFIAFDSFNGDRYYYTADGNWVGTTSPSNGGGPIIGLPQSPQIPTSVTLPNGIVVPYFGRGVPEVYTNPADGTFNVLDPVGQRIGFYNAEGRLIGGGAWYDDSGPIGSSGGTGSTSGGSTGGAVNVPEPESLALFALPVAALAWRRRRKAKGLQRERQ